MRRVLLVVSFVALGVACGSSVEGRVGEDIPEGAIVVGSFDFSESILLAQIYATALEESGFPVAREFDLGSREIVQPALEQDQIDLVPEYLGAAVTFVTLGEAEATSSSDEMHDVLEQKLRDRGIAVLQYARAQDRNGFVVTADTATQYNLINLSDLTPFTPELDFGGPPECAERPTCLAGLESVYGMSFREFQPLDVGGPETVAALAGGEVDVALLFTTDPLITENDFTLLIDDKHLQPAENVVPVLRQEAIDLHGAEVVDVINSVTEELTTDSLRALNARVSLRGQRHGSVARDWLTTIGVIR